MIRIYSDTSVISCIDAPDTPERENNTRRFFQFVRDNADEYELVISSVTVAELQKTPQPRYKLLMDFLQASKYTLLTDSDEADDLAEHYVQDGVLSDKHKDDLAHIAYSVLAKCDFIVSWNMKHFVNPKTIMRVNAVNEKYGYPKVMITTPVLFLGDDSDAET
ncbi:hypothetical protein FACS189443_3050 [Planctomycetales bacterium]|nr:hypothetical protein FACS189443_3050 [Planctomycetales bacterium]